MEQKEKNCHNIFFHFNKNHKNYLVFLNTFHLNSLVYNAKTFHQCWLMCLCSVENAIKQQRNKLIIRQKQQQQVNIKVFVLRFSFFRLCFSSLIFCFPFFFNKNFIEFFRAVLYNLTWSDKDTHTHSKRERKKRETVNKYKYI